MKTSRLTAPALLGGLVLGSLVAVSAHSVRSLASAGAATAFVASPTATADAPIPVSWGTADTGLRVVCFVVANTSMPRADRPDRPRVTAVGLELPGTLSGFSLLTPRDGSWRLVEGATAALPDHAKVTLDLAIVARGAGKPRKARGVPPGQPPDRAIGTRFCVSGPFPDTLPELGATTIERLLNGVVVEFDGVDGVHRGNDAGVWFPTAAGPRLIPLYP